MAACAVASMLAGIVAGQEPTGDYAPEPTPADTGRCLVGAFMCPLWNRAARERLDGRDCWEPIRAFPEREPLLGWYEEGTPEVTDWEIAWALNHGISFFVPCWYRARGNLGKPVEHLFGHWLHDGLFNSRYEDRFRFAILWENGNRVACGVESEVDLLENLLPYWIEHYFSRSNYLRIDGEPLLFIYRTDLFARDLGGIPQAAAALEKMRAACRQAGLAGLTVIGEHHTRLDEPLPHLTDLGLDAVTSYHWPTFSGRMPRQRTAAALMDVQEQCWEDLARVTGLPAIATVSVGWDNRPWNPRAGTGWQLTPEQIGALCDRARQFAEDRETDDLASRIVLIDNWNEFGEGHFIFPHREYGFGYLEAIRDAFAAPE